MNVFDLFPAYKRYALHERGMRPASFRSIVASVQMLCEYAKTKDLGQLDQATIKAFLYFGREQRAWEARTYRNHRQYLKSFFSWCAKQDYVPENPVEGIEKPKLPQRLPRCLTREDTQKILSHIRWYPWRYEFEAVRNETILYFLLFTGLRLQEMLSLELSDLCLASGEIIVREGKGQKERVVPIHARLLPVLRNYLAALKNRGRAGSTLFVGVSSNRPLQGKDVRLICRKISKQSGVYFTPHMLRHTFGRLTIEGGLDIFKVKEIMGHSDIGTTQGYLSVSTENLKRSLNQVTLL